MCSVYHFYHYNNNNKVEPAVLVKTVKTLLLSIQLFQGFVFLSAGSAARPADQWEAPAQSEEKEEVGCRDIL